MKLPYYQRFLAENAKGRDIFREQQQSFDRAMTDF